MPKRFNLRSSIADPRDLIYSRKNVFAPFAVSNDHPAIAREDQSDASSCTGHGLTSLLEFELFRKFGQAPQLSRLFVWACERLQEGTLDQDTGAYIPTGLKVLQKIGAPPESLWPYDLAREKVKPSPEAYAAAKRYRILEYRKLATLDDLRDNLASGHGAVLGFTVFSSFDSDRVTRTGQVPVPERGEKVLGAHCVWLTGYSDVDRQVEFINSYGSSWGRGGKGTLPYEFWERRWVDDVYTLRV